MERSCALQVDGLGHALADFDDPNVPSLLAIPLLGFSRYDSEVYAATRARLLSPANRFYFEGPKLRGLGSPHTPHSHVWPLALMIQARPSSLDGLQPRPKLVAESVRGTGLGFVHQRMHFPALSCRLSTPRNMIAHE